MDRAGRDAGPCGGVSDRARAAGLLTIGWAARASDTRERASDTGTSDTGDKERTRCRYETS